MARLARLLEGLALIAWLGIQYLIAFRVQRWWRRPARAWRHWLDRQGATWFASMARRRGALLIKIGQFAATRPDIFPLCWVDACGALRDQAPPRPWPVIAAALAEAYEGRLSDHLVDIEPTALAAASFGQVHRARTREGRVVAVKVQYPDLGPLVAADLWLASIALRLFALALPGWPFAQVRAEIERTAREEQDYLQEGTNADRLRPFCAKCGVAVPEVLWAHTREKVLVMEFAGGTTLARLDLTTLPDLERRRLADTLVDAYLTQLLDAGFFHADPHAGNLLYEPRAGMAARLWLIDFGMTATLTSREAVLYRRFLARLRADDTDGMVDVLTEIGVVLPNADRTRLKALAREIYEQLGHLDPRTFKGSRRQRELAVQVTEFLRRMDGIVFPQHTLLLSRATSLVEGLCMELVPGWSLLDLVRPRLARLTWRTQVDHWLTQGRETWQQWRKLPERIDALLNRPQADALTPMVACAALLIAAVLLPEGTLRLVAACAAGLGVLAALRRR